MDSTERGRKWPDIDNAYWSLIKEDWYLSVDSRILIRSRIPFPLMDEEPIFMQAVAFRVLPRH